MRGLYCLVVLFVIFRSASLCWVGNWFAAPHSHILIGEVSPEEFAHHHDAHSVSSPGHADSASLSHGVIISMPAGDWQLVISISDFIAALTALPFAIALAQTAHILARHQAARQFFIPLTDPPPRRVLYQPC